MVEIDRRRQLGRLHHRVVRLVDRQAALEDVHRADEVGDEAGIGKLVEIAGGGDLLQHLLAAHIHEHERRRRCDADVFSGPPATIGGLAVSRGDSGDVRAVPGNRRIVVQRIVPYGAAIDGLAGILDTVAVPVGRTLVCLTLEFLVPKTGDTRFSVGMPEIFQRDIETVVHDPDHHALAVRHAAAAGGMLMPVDACDRAGEVRAKEPDGLDFDDALASGEVGEVARRDPRGVIAVDHVQELACPLLLLDPVRRLFVCDLDEHLHDITISLPGTDTSFERTPVGEPPQARIQLRLVAPVDGLYPSFHDAPPK